MVGHLSTLFTPTSPGVSVLSLLKLSWTSNWDSQSAKNAFRMDFACIQVAIYTQSISTTRAATLFNWRVSLKLSYNLPIFHSYAIHSSHTSKKKMLTHLDGELSIVNEMHFICWYAVWYTFIGPCMLHRIYWTVHIFQAISLPS